MSVLTAKMWCLDGVFVATANHLISFNKKDGEEESSVAFNLRFVTYLLFFKHTHTHTSETWKVFCLLSVRKVASVCCTSQTRLRSSISFRVRTSSCRAEVRKPSPCRRRGWSAQVSVRSLASTGWCVWTVNPLRYEHWTCAMLQPSLRTLSRYTSRHCVQNYIY